MVGGLGSCSGAEISLAKSRGFHALGFHALPRADWYSTSARMGAVGADWYESVFRERERVWVLPTYITGLVGRAGVVGLSRRG